MENLNCFPSRLLSKNLCPIQPPATYLKIFKLSRLYFILKVYSESPEKVGYCLNRKRSRQNSTMSIWSRTSAVCQKAHSTDKPGILKHSDVSQFPAQQFANVSVCSVHTAVFFRMIRSKVSISHVEFYLIVEHTILYFKSAYASSGDESAATETAVFAAATALDITPAKCNCRLGGEILRAAGRPGNSVKLIVENLILGQRSKKTENRSVSRYT